MYYLRVQRPKGILGAFEAQIRREKKGLNEKPEERGQRPASSFLKKERQTAGKKAQSASPPYPLRRKRKIK